MSTVTISGLPATTSSSGSDVYPLVQSGTTKKITYTNLFTNVTLITPDLGTPSAGVLTSCTGLPIDGGTSGTLPVARGGTGVTASTGSGSLVLNTSPTFVTPVLGVATATTVNKVTITAPATAATFTLSDSKTFAVTNTLTLSGTDGTVMTFPTTSATLARRDGTNTFSGDQTFSAATIQSVQTLSGAGAVNITTYTTTIATTGANALTLADGTLGQIKFLVMVADGGDGTLTPTNLANYTTITFNDVGDSCVLQFLSNGVTNEWYVISNNGCTLA